MDVVTRYGHFVVENGQTFEGHSSNMKHYFEKLPGLSDRQIKNEWHCGEFFSEKLFNNRLANEFPKAKMGKNIEDKKEKQGGRPGSNPGSSD